MCLIPTGLYRIISAYSQGKSPWKFDSIYWEKLGKIKVKENVEKQSFTRAVKPDLGL